jgi:hypothetical protein
MAITDGPTSGPDLQALIRASMPQQAGGGVMYLFGGAKETINVGQGLAPQGAALIKADGTFKMGSQKRESPLAKLLGDLGFKREDFVKGFTDAKNGAPVREASQAEFFGQGGPVGGSFSAMVGNGPSVGGGIDL